MKLGTILTAILLALSPVAITDDAVSPRTTATAQTEDSARTVTDSSPPILPPTLLRQAVRNGELELTSSSAGGTEDRSVSPMRRSIRSEPLSGRASSCGQRSSREDFDWPTSSTTVLRKFDHLKNNWDSGHRGVDLASKPDEQIRAAGPGRVVYAGRVVDSNVISIEHATGLRTTYLPVTASVEVGDCVDTGDIIGTIEEGHCLPGACLHWGAKRGDVYYDPLSLLGSVEIRLYPVGS